MKLHPKKSNCLMILEEETTGLNYMAIEAWCDTR
jgi:hypothetical protein